MSERDDLIDLIDGATWSLIDSDVVADAILAAGWVKRGPTEKDAMLDRMLADPDQYYAEAWERAGRGKWSRPARLPSQLDTAVGGPEEEDRP